MKTRDRIITAATKLFNDKGYGTVNLKELAQEIGISRGNLTYHFKNKSDLLEAIVEQMWAKMAKEKEKTLQVPSFQNMHNQNRMYHDFQNDYAFVFLDTHVQNHPVVNEQFKDMIEQTIEGYHKMIAMGIQIGTVQKETIPGTYRSLAVSVWMVSFYWLSQQSTRGKSNSKDRERIVWGLILPHMTDEGIAGFMEYFGEAYQDMLGETFKVSQYATIKF